MREYTELSFDEENPGEPRFVLSTPVDAEGRGRVHEIPLRAVADRMELFGLETPEEALDVIVKLARNPELGDELYASLHEAYGGVVRAEARAAIAANGVVSRQVDGAQTALGVNLVSEETRRPLTEARERALARIAELDAPETLSAAAVEQEPPRSLPLSAAVTEEICRRVREETGRVADFRVSTALDHASALADAVFPPKGGEEPPPSAA
ncbi:hypothetical protein DFP74_3274 [Nocardiopsis sp. Huas11]|uniref:hypothetical protein n=1 Tax=Nocardiopsis sp. Huas11 TaxID=2183912 RepID=UPI000EB36B86|nr:hypothetical protein [Nocardiopsis sp. Huas11]RKS07596.1 hypothetical protein DFP74_3274 [Nocardiopsis sp. Huas11]